MKTKAAAILIASALCLMPGPVLGRAWTLMVYMDADNDLEGAGLEDFLEMSSVGSSPDLAVVVQMDRAEGYENGYGDWRTAQRFCVKRGMVPVQEEAIQDLGEVNSGDPQTLVHFVTWATSEFPADHYGLILWDHGSGWKAQALQPEPVKSICVDVSSGMDSITCQELDRALRASTARVGRKLDLLGFDACLMAMVEIAVLSEPYASFMVASEEVEPGDGWPYDDVLNAFSFRSDTSPQDLGRLIVQKTVASYENGSQGSKDATLSCVDLDRFASLNVPRLLDDLARGLRGSIREDCLGFQSVAERTQKYEDEDFVDLGDWLAGIRGWVEDLEAIQSVEAVRRTLLPEGCLVCQDSVGASVARSHGLSIYVPAGPCSPAYAGLEFARETAWDEMLQEECHFTVGHDFLLVDDDEGAKFEAWYRESLIGLGCGFDLYDVSLYGPISDAVVQSYLTPGRGILWFTGDVYESTLTDSDQRILSSFLRNGGRLCLTGQDIGLDIGESEFFRVDLKARFVEDTVRVSRILGNDEDPLGAGMACVLNEGDGARNQFHPSGLSPVEDATPVFWYEQSDLAAGLHVQCGKGEGILLAFGWEGLSSREDRDLLLSRILGVLLKR